MMNSPLITREKDQPEKIDAEIEKNIIKELKIEKEFD